MRRHMAWIGLLVAMLGPSIAHGSGLPQSCSPRTASLHGVPGAMPRDSLFEPNGPSSFAYDWTRGYAGLSGAGAFEMRGCDTLTAVGPDPGTPVDLHFRLHLVADIDSMGPTQSAGFDFELWWFTLGEALSFTDGSSPGASPKHIDGTQDLVIHRTMGVPFPMRWQISAGAPPGRRFLVRGRWELIDLPDGVRVQSRAGFDPGVVSVHRSSWGRLKTLSR